MRFANWHRLGSPIKLSLLLVGALWIAAITLTSKTGSSQPPRSAASATSGRPILASWGTPLAALVFTGDIHGYLEPCGCSERQAGGFARRSDLIKQLRDESKWPVAAFDIGGSMNEYRISYPQTRIKFAVMLKGLNQMGYKGIALGKEELLLGAPELFTQHANFSAQPEHDVPFLSANSTLFGTSSQDLGTPLPARIVKVGNLNVGVIAITGNSIRTELKNSGILHDPSELKVDDPLTLLPGVLQQVQAKNPDILVLLSHSSMEESKQLATQFPQFQIVVTAGSAEDPARTDAVYIGKTLMVQVGKKGKYAGVVGIFPNKQMKFELLQLDVDRFRSDPLMTELMKDYQGRLKDAWTELSAQTIPNPSAGSFVGVESCKSCHEAAYDVWASSNHAHGYQSLIDGRKGQDYEQVSRIYDPECLCCHTTGWDPQRVLRYESGFIDMQNTPLLAGQQCENCHGPGSKHVEFERALTPGAPVSEDVLAARQSMHLSLEQAKQKTCNGCHDLDNSPKFDFDEYWPQIAH